MRKISLVNLVIAFACFISFQTYGQQSRTNYHLLWKISGNGLQKPSYLFGTMHLKDKRVFDFSDSVLVKLDECPAFAMEILPDTILKAMFTQYLPGNTGDTTDKLSQMLTKEEYALLDKRLQEESGMSINRLKSKDPWVINMLLDKSVVVPRKGDKSTFLDAYLFRLAKQQNKQLIGLEKMEEQTSVKNDYTSLKEQIKTIRTKLDKSYESKFLEEMIKLYWSGDVDKLYAMLYKAGVNENYRHKMLTVRNQTMVERLSGYIRNEQTFIAVGAAHLPGEDGMVKLLQKKGFSVTPVKATFTGLAGRYKEQTGKESWYTFVSAENAYAIDMPSEPFPLEFGGDKGNQITMYTYPDLSSGMVYYSAGFALPTKIEASKQEEFFKRIIEGMVSNKSSRLLSEKKITFDGNPGREVELYDGKEAMYMRCRIYLRQTMLYMLMAGGTREQLAGTHSLRFLDSFRLQAFAPADWKDLADADGAFRVKAPVTLVRQTREQEIEGTENVKSLQTFYTGADKQQSVSYTALYNDFSAGYVILDDSLYFSSIINLAAQRTKGSITELRNSNLQAYPGKAYTITSSELTYYCRVYLRGNRVYYLIVTTPSATDQVKKEAETFLNSFAFTDFKKPVWQKYNAPNNDFSIQTPGKMISEEDSSEMVYAQLQTSSYVSHDPHSGLSYFVVKNRYADYFEAKDESSYFNDLLKNSLSEKDTLLSETTIRVNGMPGRDVLIQTRGNHTVRRIRMVLKGSALYQVMMYLPETWTDNTAISTFFDSFQFGKQEPAGNLFSKKAVKLLADLTSPDTLIQKKARSAINQFAFTSEDLPALYTAIGKGYPDDAIEYGSTRQLLLHTLARVPDAATPAFIKQLYPTLPEDHPAWQLAALRALTAINSNESLTLFTDLILSKTPKPTYDQSLFYSLADSLDNSKVLFPRIMALHLIPQYTNNLYWLTSQMCKKGLLTKEDLASYRLPLLTDGKARLAKHLQTKKDDEIYSSDAYTLQLLTGILGSFGDDKECESLLAQIMTSRDDELALAAGLVLLNKNKAVDKKRIAAIGANPSLRLELYNELISLKKKELFPKKFLTQEHFAEASLISYLLLDEEGTQPDKTVLLETREQTHEGKRGRVYLYKFMYKGEEGEKDTWYVAVSGPQPLSKKEVSSEGELTYTAWSILEDKTIEEHYQELINPK